MILYEDKAAYCEVMRADAKFYIRLYETHASRQRTLLLRAIEPRTVAAKLATVQATMNAISSRENRLERGKPVYDAAGVFGIVTAVKSADFGDWYTVGKIDMVICTAEEKDRVMGRYARK